MKEERKGGAVEFSKESVEAGFREMAKCNKSTPALMGPFSFETYIKIKEIVAGWKLT